MVELDVVFVESDDDDDGGGTWMVILLMNGVCRVVL
jgi:hypothetical protein